MAKFDLKDKLVLLTGASSGIGMAAALRLAEERPRLALVGRSETALASLADAIRARGREAEPFAQDLTDLAAIPELVERVATRFGRSVDVLINSAGIAILGNVEDVPASAYQEILAVNFYAPVELIRAVLPGMKANRGGLIVNITSGVGKRGLPGVSPYCVSKAALNSMTESLRVEAAPHGIHVLLFSPGLAETSFSAKIKKYGPLDDDFTGGRLAHPDDIANSLLCAIKSLKRETLASLRAKAGYHLNYWAPGLLDRILMKKARR